MEWNMDLIVEWNIGIEHNNVNITDEHKNMAYGCYKLCLDNGAVARPPSTHETRSDIN